MARSKRTVAIEHGLRFVGKPYFFGGQGPAGLDCSGLLTEIFRAVGKIGRRSDYNAQGYFNMYRHRERMVANPGDLVFYGDGSNDITHMGMAVEVLDSGDVLILEAAGGRRGTDTLEEAQALDAMVTLRPINSRRDLVAICDPWEG